MFTSPK